MAKSGLLKKATRRLDILFRDEQTPWQNPDRAFQHAHVLIKQQMGDFGSIQESLNGGNQHGVVGANKLAHDSL
jgi:hypothetical protein